MMMNIVQKPLVYSARPAAQAPAKGLHFGSESVYNFDYQPLYVKKTESDRLMTVETNTRLKALEGALTTLNTNLGGKLDQLITLLTPVNPPTKDL